MRRFALPVTLAVALTALAIVLRERRSLPETPEAAVRELFDAAERGDVDGYLRVLSRELQASLLGGGRGSDRESLQAEIERTAKGVKGLAVTRTGEDPGGRVSLDLDIVFDGHNERQRMLLRPEGSGWIIESFDRASRVEQAIPYGTPVFEGIGEPAGAEGAR